MDFSAVLERAKRGEKSALTELHRHYEPLVLARVRDGMRSVLRRHYDTQDLGQTVLLEVLRDLARFEDRGERAFRHWIYIKAENTVRSKLRKHLDRAGGAREVALGSRDERTAAARGPGPATSAGQADAQRRLQELLASLDASHREIIVLRAAEGLSFEAIAQRLALRGAEAARKRYARAILILRRRWASE